MLKRERQKKILQYINQQGSISVLELVDKIGVSDMTIRRDFEEMTKNGLIERTHGGAKSLNMPEYEKSHIEKQDLQIHEKKEIAKLATQFINDSETVFIGPGTTLEHLANEIMMRKIRVITNSLPVFTILKNSPTVDLILIGGEYRYITGAFVGSLAIENIKSLKFSKAFVSSNGVNADTIATYSEEEGKIQCLALECSIEKFLLIDYSKFGKYDFYQFYDTSKLDYILTNSIIPQKYKELLSQKTKLITTNKN